MMSLNITIENDSTGKQPEVTVTTEGESAQTPGSTETLELARTSELKKEQESGRTHDLEKTPGPQMLLESTRTPGPTSISDQNNETEPQEEIHLRLGIKELRDCFPQTTVRLSEMMTIFRFPLWTELVNRFYRVLYAKKIVIKGFVSKFEKRLFRDEVINRTGHNQHSRDGLETKIFRCGVKVRVPREYVVVELQQHIGSSIELFDAAYYHDFNDCFDRKASKKDYSYLFESSSNVVTFVPNLILFGMLSDVDDEFVAVFHGVPRKGLQMKRTAFNRGILETPLYRERTIILNAPIYPWVRVTVPVGHSVMVSFPMLVVQQCIVLLAEDAGNKTLAKFCPADEIVRANIYNISLLLLYIIPKYYDQEGFQIYFSFHNTSSLPAKLDDRLWNCSFLHRSDLLHHLSCNMDVECDDAADEMDCPFTSDHCGSGYLTLGGGCFFYERRRESKISFHTAADMCSRRGGRLANLNTDDKWEDATAAMSLSFRVNISVGIRSMPRALPMWYRYGYQWSDGTTAFTRPVQAKVDPSGVNVCGFWMAGMYSSERWNVLSLTEPCLQKTSNNILCEKTLPAETTRKSILINGTTRLAHNAQYVKCPLGHYTHRFLACDAKTSCWYDGDRSPHCGKLRTTLMTYFSCNNHMERISYTLVCDHRSDCADDSDEDFCTFFKCQLGQFMCDNKQCIPLTKTCNGWADCRNNEDEDQCRRTYVTLEEPSIRPPVLVSVSRGKFTLRPLNETCPDTHFQCLDNGNCLPLFLRCNGVHDCYGHEDERACDLCPFYRCRGSKVCLHDSAMCDGHAICPQHDDELLCDSDCPAFCVCTGLAFFCRRSFRASAYPLLRFLDASSSAMTPAQLKNNTLLIHLTLANCSLTDLQESFFPNLLSLDIRDNHVSNVSHLHLDSIPSLRDLSVAGNPLAIVFEGVAALSSFPQIIKLDLSRSTQSVLDVNALSVFPNLLTLNLSHSGVQRIAGEGFGVMEQLRVIDLRGCPMTWIPHGLFHGLSHLQAVHVSSFKMCCSAVLPREFNIRHCFAPTNELSSCADLLCAAQYSVCVFVASLLALVGNVVSFTFRTCISKRKTKLGYGNFVTHLSISDFLMGVYLAIIGIADQVYRGIYLWNDLAWRHSVVCKLAGLLSLLSSEVSALIMCLITLDRFLVIRFPFSKSHFSPVSSQTASVIVWIIGILLSTVPLLPVTSHWEFYSQTGICIPLPITREGFAGHNYSFGLMIVFNFVLFLFITVGQLNIYWAVRSNSMSVSNTTKKTKDLTIARRLITVAMTDFLCWFPIGVLGLMASNGFPISGDINVAVAIFVLPLNSAVNPCLYTFNAIQERRSRARVDKLRRLLTAQFKLTNNTEGSLLS